MLAIDSGVFPLALSPYVAEHDESVGHGDQHAPETVRLIPHKDDRQGKDYPSQQEKERVYDCRVLWMV